MLNLSEKHLQKTSYFNECASKILSNIYLLVIWAPEQVIVNSSDCANNQSGNSCNPNAYFLEQSYGNIMIAEITFTCDGLCIIATLVLKIHYPRYSNSRQAYRNVLLHTFKKKHIYKRAHARAHTNAYKMPT